MSGEPYSLPVLLARVPPAGKHFRLAPDESERRAIAAALEIAGVTELAADLEVRPFGAEGFSVRGELRATVVQTDVVTLEPVTQAIREEIELLLQPAEGTARSGAEGVEPLAERDVYHGGRVDLGAIVVEHLALGLDPYPRLPGVEFPGHLEDAGGEKASPFAALAKLKRDGE